MVDTINPSRFAMSITAQSLLCKYWLGVCRWDTDTVPLPYTTMVDKILWNTCIIAWIICVLKTEFEQAMLSLFKIPFCDLLPTPYNVETLETCKSIVGGVGEELSKCSWIDAWLFVWRVWKSATSANLFQEFCRSAWFSNLFWPKQPKPLPYPGLAVILHAEP